MAATVPAALKNADVQRFATRAAQLEKYKPIATYWLEYYILQQILSRQLHATSPEVGEYAVQLMDKVEEVKTQYANEAAITDDVAAKAYMEQFASDTFQKAEDAQNTDKVTRQTADAFQAAATFYDSLSIWGELDQESKAKSKFAKFHALRIARALKEGKDPNETNPRVELPPAPAEHAELEAELKDMAARSATSRAVEPNTDGFPVAPFPAALFPEASESSTTRGVEPEVDTTVAISDRPVLIGGGYFPSIPSAIEPPVLPSTSIMSAPHIDEEDHIPNTTDNELLSPQIDVDSHIPPTAPTSHTHVPAAAPPVAVYGGIAVRQAPVQAAEAYKTDDEAVMEAQKHAKWAISALNFEDVPTAVKELRIALQALGGL